MTSSFLRARFRYGMGAMPSPNNSTAKMAGATPLSIAAGNFEVTMATAARSANPATMNGSMSLVECLAVMTRATNRRFSPSSWSIGKSSHRKRSKR